MFSDEVFVKYSSTLELEFRNVAPLKPIHRSRPISGLSVDRKRNLIVCCVITKSFCESRETGLQHDIYL